jgi:hypothetical protein
MKRKITVSLKPEDYALIEKALGVMGLNSPHFEDRPPRWLATQSLMAVARAVLRQGKCHWPIALDLRTETPEETAARTAKAPPSRWDAGAGGWLVE